MFILIHYRHRTDTEQTDKSFNNNNLTTSNRHRTDTENTVRG